MNTLAVITNKEMLQKMLPRRFSESNKGSYGRVAVLCGSEKMPGASRLVSRAAYAAGAGLVISFGGESFSGFLKNDIPEVIVKTVQENLFKTFSGDLYQEIEKELLQADVTAFGCGIGQNEDLEKVLQDLILNNKKTLIIDGDGINILKNNKELLIKDRSGEIILTPHPKEMSRLTGLSLEYILKNPEKTALNFAKEYNVYLLLKGHQTLIATPLGEAYANNTGNSALSKAGTGDVLTGLIAGFISQGASSLDSLLLSAWLHGKSGEIASRSLTQYCVMASDIISCLPQGIKILQGDENIV